ncbi:hypothetical protein HNO88_003385 [Novosphingobium chloroacetimidivorans]|uniref:Phage tail assembly chaperone n=1 Tax=Novosphingobium chloroacetimidivorans TaxID=1428314 RepID=A0A7W7NYB1_9SPHN|nr:phage tail assembly chaperone [Novosphingobium chloroacetimidivorans]MBB4860047.1 hypothetical protein [Novosphingobium chloroacetimidivorans]
MSERFGPMASALSGVAARRLGWRPDVFWHATLAELTAALARDASPPIDAATLRRLMEQDHG